MQAPAARVFSPAWLGPRYWGTWLSLALLRLLVLLPFPAQLALGQALGIALGHLLGRRRRIAETNLTLCFPELSREARARLLWRSFESLGLALIEVGMAWWGSDARLRRLVEIEGLEHLRAALTGGRGAILLSAHFTTLEIGGRLLRLFQPFRPIYRPTKNPLWDWVMLRRRQQHVERAIDRRDVRGMFRALRANEPVWYAPDQDYGREHSVFVPFFGVLAATITATSRLAALSGAPVVPFFQYRKPDGSGYRLVIEPPLEGFPGPDPAADAERINRLIEARVREHPEQYLWSHRRFKTRPPGEAPPYD
jgi:KDO2-lipid IV(A) lauroyltransferase